MRRTSLFAIFTSCLIAFSQCNISAQEKKNKTPDTYEEHFSAHGIRINGAVKVFKKISIAIFGDATYLNKSKSYYMAYNQLQEQMPKLKLAFGCGVEFKAGKMIMGLYNGFSRIKMSDVIWSPFLEIQFGLHFSNGLQLKLMVHHTLDKNTNKYNKMNMTICTIAISYRIKLGSKFALTSEIMPWSIEGDIYAEKNKK